MTNEIANERFELVPCPVCGNRDLSAFLSVQYGSLKQKSSLDYSVLGITRDTWLHVKKCRECGLVFVNPRLKPEHEHLVYNECKANLYVNKRELFTAGTKSFALESRKRKLEYLGPLLETMTYLPPEAGDLVLFDYGCGAGYSMSLARELGVEVYGVDVDEERLRLCRSLNFKVAAPERFDAEFPGVKADIILWQSNIEHLLDVRAAMSYLRAKAKPGGLLYVNGLTPKIISAERRRGEYVKAHFVEHVNYFPVRTLDRLFAQFGFKPLPFAHSAVVNSFRSALEILGVYLMITLPGQASWGGQFKRIYRLEG